MKNERKHFFWEIHWDWMSGVLADGSESKPSSGLHGLCQLKSEKQKLLTFFWGKSLLSTINHFQGTDFN